MIYIQIQSIQAIQFIRILRAIQALQTYTYVYKEYKYTGYTYNTYIYRIYNYTCYTYNTRVYRHIQNILTIHIIRVIQAYTIYTDAYKHIHTFLNTNIYEHIQIILTIRTRSLLYERGPPSSFSDYTNVIQTYTDNIRTVFVYVCIIHQYTNYTNRQNHIRTCKTADVDENSLDLCP